MSGYIDDSKIKDEVDTKHAPHIPYSAQEKIFNSIAKIKVNIDKKPSYGTAFFMKIRIKNDIYHFLVTCYHIIGQDKVDSKEKIAIYYKNKNEVKEQFITLNRKRFIKCYDKPIDISIIEILESDKIPDDKYLIPDMNYKIGYDFYLKYSNKYYLAGYPNVATSKGEEHITSGYITKIDSFKFVHNLDTRSGSSGSPICLIDNKNVIGIHKGGDKDKSINFGTFIGIVLDKLENENIKQFKNDEELEYINEFKKCDKNIILVGRMGAGKTYFLNKICKTNFKINLDLISSLENNIQYSYTENGEMLLIDFPGKFFESFKGLKTMKKILIKIPIKMICIVVKYNRYGIIINDIKSVFKVFYNYKNNITIIVVFEEDEKIDKEEIIFIIKTKYNIQNILFSNNADYKSLEEMQSKMQNIPQMILTNREILSIMNNHKFDLKIWDERTQLLEDFNEALETFEKELKNINDSDLTRAFYFALKNYKESLIEKFTEIMKKKTENTEKIINELTSFNNEILKEFIFFKNLIESQIEIKISNNNNKSCNEFRRCPYCGLIWCQIQGCNDVMCGERSDTKDLIYGIYKNYIVKYENKKITIETETINNLFKGNGARILGLKEEEEVKNIALKKSGKQEIKLMGCGKWLKWDEMEDMTEYVINKFLRDIPITDYDSDVIKISENLE